MDKRLSIALLLTALVVAVTPILFPTPRRVAPTTATGGDSVPVQQQPALQPTRSPVAPAVVAPVADSAASPDMPAPVVETATRELTTASTPKSTYRFSNLGAVPVSVMFDEYPILAPGKSGSVELADPGRALLSYALVL